MLTLTTASSGQQYTIVDLGDIGQIPPTVGLEKPIQFNKNYEVAATIFESGSPRAAVWLPEAIHGITLGVMTKLNTHSGSSGANKATDINQLPWVVGQSSGRAFVWKLDEWDGTNPIPTIDLGELESGKGSIAYALNETSNSATEPVFVVGTAPITDTQSGCPGNLADHGFYIDVLSSGAGTMQDLDPSSTSNQALALDVDNNDPAEIVGVDRECDIKHVCLPNHHALWWNTQPMGPTVLADLSTTAVWGAGARGLNDARNIVGWSMFDISSQGQVANCRERAVWWEDKDESPPVNLHSFGTQNFDDRTIAEALSEPDNDFIQVVGHNVSDNLALLWETDDGGVSWTETVLENAIVGRCATGATGCQREWELWRAFDITDDGYIVGWGRLSVNGGTFEPHYFMLAPITQAPCATCCEGDTNCSGAVDVADLLSVLGAWGFNPGHEADLNCDGVVSVIDQLEVLGNWGACAESLTGGNGATVADLEEALVVLGFDGVADFRAWGLEAGEAELSAMALVIHVLLDGVND